ncbi:MAG: ABC transporter permease, partial [Halobacteriaceae archaeon]
ATFLIIYLGPVDPAARIAGSAQNAQNPQAYQNAVEQLNLDEPVHQQYLKFIWDMITLDLGQSWLIQPNTPAADLILAYAPRTLWLGFWSVLIAIFIGVPLGFYAGLNSNSAGDYLTSFSGIVWRAMPNFWLAVMLVNMLV